MKIEHLEEFVAVVKRGGITAAARELYLSQPSLSAHLDAVEKELGFKLFDRGNGACATLTREGIEFLPYAQNIIDSFTMGKNHCKQLRAELPPLKIMAIPPLSNEYDLLCTAANVKTKFVDFDFQSDVFEAVAAGTLDLAFISDYAMVPEMVETAQRLGIRWEPTGESTIVLVVMASNPLACKDTLTARDLDKGTMVVTSTTLYEQWVATIKNAIGPGINLYSTIDASLGSSAEYARWNFGNSLYFCSLDLIRQRFANRTDIKVFHEIDGHPLLVRGGAIYRSCDYDERYELLLEALRKQQVNVSAQ